MLKKRVEVLEAQAKQKTYKPRNFNDFYKNDPETMAAFNRFYQPQATNIEHGNISTSLQ